ncbi:MAG: UdgX family uracil-DNA binding protein [Verrucomicrobiota bacterium JB022]|nr:UdgX family uracil-DNA binding protein [Verrucomicrobiota bacterium JB022]
MEVVTIEPTYPAWRQQALRLLQAGVLPEHVDWREQGEAQASLFADAEPQTALAGAGRIPVPKAFVELAQTAACHRPAVWPLLYRVLWRLTLGGDRHLLEKTTDDDVHRLTACAKNVRRDCHKMHAFVRFRKVGEVDGQEQFVAWFEPEHRIAAFSADFFVKRFAAMNWSIFTPEESIHWDGEILTVGKGADRSAVPAEDAQDELWRSYYRSTFNPARLRLKAMQAEMPRKYWQNLPEAALIETLTRESGQRTHQMLARQPEAPRPAPRNAYLHQLHALNEASPVTDTGQVAASTPTLSELRREAERCQACTLWERSTQTVFGEGNERAGIMLVGEQPGDQEDLSGRAFVGPAGQLLNAALASAGIDREELYVTNAVKHFKWKAGHDVKRRLHDKASTSEIEACRPWLWGEILNVQPKVIVTLGNTPAQSLIRPDFKILTMRGMHERSQIKDLGAVFFATVHPSYLLRLPEADREHAMQGFIADLRAAKALLDTMVAPPE